MRVYISGALDAAKDLEKARQKYDTLALMIDLMGHSPYTPHHATDPIMQAHISSSTVFATDRSALIESDIIVAFLDEPSFGVGAEVAIAIQEGKLVVGLLHESKRVSRFLGGLIEESLGIIINYASVEQAAVSLEQWIITTKNARKESVFAR